VRKDTNQSEGKSSGKTAIREKVLGRPRQDMKPKTALAARLQQILGSVEKFPKISKTMKVSPNSAARYLRGERDPPAEVLARVVAETGCDGHWLLTGEPRNPAVAEFEPEYDIGRQPQALMIFPVVGRAAADDSGGTLVEFEHERKWLRHQKPIGCVEVHGDSLAPLAFHGQHVFIDLTDRTIENGCIVALETTDGRTFVKRWFRRDRVIVLESINPVDPQPPVLLKEKDIRQAYVVIGVWFD